MAKKHILLIEDDDIVIRTIERSLRGEEFRISKAKSGVEGIKTARNLPPDLILLDVIMPGMDGYEVCRELRADPILKNIPVIFLTAKIKDQDRFTGYRAGADDYISKPFSIEELILRINAVLRRAHPAAQAQPPVDRYVALKKELPNQVQIILEEIENQNKPIEAYHCLIVGNFLLDTRSHEIHTEDGRRVLLTPVQYDLLYHLMSHTGEVFSPARLLDEVWDYPTNSGSSDLVRVHIKNLRERIEKNPKQPQFIRTVPGYGYMIDPGTSH
ncbi:MAG TPA: response regulator transcription factor [Anaerolineales bacterium]|nr:response regulator transcription factor [Anaerolineales bacterium]